MKYLSRISSFLAGQRLLLVLCLIFLFAIEGWGTAITLTYDDVSATSYSTSEQIFTDGVSFGYVNVMRNGSNGTPSGWAKDQVIQVKASGTLYNKAAISTISNIRVYVVANTNSFTLTYGTTTACNGGSITRPTTATGSESITYSSYADKKVTPGQSTTATYYDFDLSSSSPTYFKITNGSNTIYIWKVVVTYSSATSYTLTFKEWDGGGDASGSPSTGSVTENATSFSYGATAPSKTGHSIEGFYTNTSASSGVKVASSSRSFVASIDGWTNSSSQYTKGANANLYIKWTPKTTVITLDKGTSGTTDGSVSYTYGNSSRTGDITHATKTGYHLNGYYTAASSGTKILNADGTIAGNSIVVSTTTYTDASGNWAYDGTSLTLYAQWTIDNYTIQWKVNNEDWDAGSPSTAANYNTKPATIPTAPESGDCDGSKVFVGWTNSSYSHASTAPTTLFSSQASAPAITENTTFHAVFANRSGSAPVASTITGSYASHTGWTESNSICTGGSGGDAYWVLCTGGTLTSPSISDLSTVSSITFSARTYGGSSYKTIVVETSGGTSVGSANASSNTLTSGYSISVSGLTGSGSLVFSSSTTAASSGPGIDAITINYTTGGYTYSNYATSCCTKRDITLANNGKAKGGTYSADYSSTCAGTTVTLSASSNNADSVFSSWTVCKTGDAGTTVTVTDNQFSMPDYNVTVSATFAAKVQTPTFSLSAGTYSNDQSLTLSTATEGATLYYTLTTNSSDPATPTASSTAYTGAITIDHNDTRIKVIAVKSGFTDSEVSSGTYYLKCATPTFSLAEDTYLGSQNVSLATTTTSAAIHYTTDESTPSGSSTTYSDALTVSSSQTIKAIATKSNYQNSDVASAAYTITPASTVAWYVNGSELSGGDLGSAPTLVATDSKVSAVPPAPANNTLSSCANTFMGWSTTNIGTTPVTAAASITALGLFTDAASSPTIASNTTFYAVFAERTQSSPDVNTVLWSESFDGMKGGATPTSPGSGAVVYGDATITYTCANGGGTSPGTTSVQSNNYAGGTSPEMMVGQKGSGVSVEGGYFYASGIPSEGAAALTVSYKQNGYDLDVSTPTTGYSGSNSSKIAGAKSFDVTVGSASTFELKFQAGSTNVRLDDIEVKVKTAGYTTTNYVTICSDAVARVTYNANGGSASSCTSGVYTKAGFTLCSTEPTKAGYSFSGWSDGTSTHDAGADFTLTGDTTFTAQWTAKVDTYIDNMHGNEIDDASTRGVYTVPSLTDESTATEGICSVRHYKFIGWVAEEDVDEDGLPTDPPFAAGDTKAATGTTYYAVWAEEITE